MAGKLGTKICEYILGGMSLNSSVEEWIFKNITFTQASAKHLQLAISINRTLRQLTGNLYIYIYILCEYSS